MTNVRSATTQASMPGLPVSRMNCQSRHFRSGTITNNISTRARRAIRAGRKEMIVNGRVTMSVSMNVIGLETDAVEVNEYGRFIITDPDQFFLDWSNDWEQGIGELLGASDESIDLYVDEEAE